MQTSESINPCLYSVEEAKYLVKHLGEPPEVAGMDATPAGVNPQAVLPLLDRIYRLQQQADSRGLQWCGIQAVKDGFQTYVNVFAQWQEDQRRGAPKFPSQYVWDASGRGHKGAVGADGGVIHTYFDETGTRKSFVIELLGTSDTYVPTWARKVEKQPIPKLIHDQAKGTIECPVCHLTHNYDPQTRSTFNLAMGRMQKHLTSATKDSDMHREVFTQEFGTAHA